MTSPYVPFEQWVTSVLTQLRTDVAAVRAAVGTTIPAKITQLERSVMATQQEIQAQLDEANNSTNNIAEDVARLKERLDQALADNSAELDAAVSSALQEVSDGLTPLVSRLQGVAAETPEDVEPPAEPTA